MNQAIDNTRNAYDNHNGAKASVDFSDSFMLNDRPYGKVEGRIDFQCIAIEGVPGLVYFNFVPKGKRKERSIAVHQERIQLL